MSKIIIPENQSLYPTPNEHINFEFEDSIEEYRTSRYLNSILRMYGTDVLIWGINLQDISINNEDHIFTFNQGSLIQDSTLIRILYPFSLDINIPFEYYSEFTHSTTGRVIPDSDYSVVLITEFKYQIVTEVPTIKPNVFNVKIGLLDRLTNTLYDKNQSVFNFNHDKHRLVLYAAPIDNLYYLHDEVNINGHIFHVPGSIKSASSCFEYESFTYDGGIIDIC